MTESLSLDATQETKLVILQLKVERLEEKQAENLERIRANERWIFGAAAVIAAGTTLLGLLAQISKAYL